MKFRIGSGLVRCEVDWEEFRDTVSSKKSSVQHIEDVDVYRVFAIDGSVCYSTLLFRGSVAGRTDVAQETNDAWVAEFESSYMPFSNYPLEYTREDGVQRVQLEPANIAKRARIKGFKLECSLAQDAETPTKTSTEFEWDAPIAFQGIDGIWVANHNRDDFIELFAYCKAGTAKATWEAAFGAWPFGGLTETPVDVDVFCFGQSVYLPDSGKLPQIVAEGVFDVPSFVGLRLDYWAHAPTGEAPYVTGMFRLWVTP